MVAKNSCNAPCIINASSAFRAVFCELEHAHGGDHSVTMKDIHDDAVTGTISWNYLGVSEAGGSISYAPSLDKRCINWLHGGPLPGLISQSPVAERASRHHLFTSVLGEYSSGFCCEEAPEHKGKHKRSGTFEPLGIKWEIVW